MRLSTESAPPKISFTAKRPLFYYITARKQLHGVSLISVIRRILDWGVDFIQIREKDLNDRTLFDLTCKVVSLVRGSECRILVNGRADIALAAGAHGVHLPSTGLQVRDIRKWLPENFLIGTSVHTIGEIRRASAQGADYFLMGHIFPTKSKEAYGSPVGLDALRKACATATAPVLGLGGISPERIHSVLDAGAAGIAGITLFQNKKDFSRLKKNFPHTPIL
jgi:thiamine-phosphate pyrophosphorylase